MKKTKHFKLDANTIKYYRSCGILDKWHTLTLNNFVNDDRAKKIVEGYIDDIKEAKKDGTGIYLYSEVNGCGKSLILNSVFKQLIEMRYTVHVVSMPTLITLYTQGWSDVEQRKTLMRIMQKVDFLAIEELGKGGKTDLANLVIESVVRWRVQMKKPIWITTNMKPSNVANIYSEDVASMLNEACLILHVKGDDYRPKIQEQIKTKYK